MGNYSKLIAAIIGPVLGFLVSAFGLPENLASTEMQTAIVTLVSAVTVFLAPANTG